MTELKKLGIILIIVGVFIPSIFYPFASLSRYTIVRQIYLGKDGVVYQPRLNDLEVVLRAGKWNNLGNNLGYYEGHIAIPYHYILAVGITIAFLGIALVALTGKKNKKRR